VTVSVGQAASDMDQMVGFMGERLIGHEGQCVVVELQYHMRTRVDPDRPTGRDPVFRISIISTCNSG